MPLGYIIKEKGWWLDNNSIEKVIHEVFEKNPDQVKKAKANPNLAGWFVGQVLKIENDADPKLVKQKIDDKLKGIN